MPAGANAGRRYFDRLIELSARATDKDDRRESWLTVAGRPVCIRFANPEFETRLLPALRHLAREAAGFPDLTIHAWDSASTGSEPTPWPWMTADGRPYLFRADWGRGAFLPESRCLFLLDRESRVGVFWTADVSALPIVEQGSPLLHIWAWWLGDGVVQFTHAAAVADEHGAALLLGAGGAGKSSTALRALDSPLFYLADDYCLISAVPEPHVFSLYSSGKVNVADRDRFPWLNTTFAGLDAEKALFHLYPVFARKLATEKPLKELLLCRVTGEAESSMVPVSSSDVTRMVAPGTIIQLHTLIEPAAALRTLAGIARQLPAYQLNLGANRDRIPGLIAESLAR